MIKTAAQILLTATLCLAYLQAGAKGPILFEEPNPWASGNICEMTSEDFLAKSHHPANLTPQGNKEGQLGTGLCWWHSKMQRAAIYLAVFDRPHDPAPTAAEAAQIFRDLADLKKIVSIPGFQNWYDFTFAYSNEFYKELNDFEVRDILQLQFFKGLRSANYPSDLMLTKIDQEVNDYRRLTFLLTKMNMLSAHSWLVSSFERRGPDFNLAFIDSNESSQTQSYQSVGNTYKLYSASSVALMRNPITGRPQHDTKYPPPTQERNYPGVNKKGLAYFTGEEMAPFLQNDDLAFQQMANAIRQHCGRETPFTLKEKENVKLKLQREFARQNWYRPGNPHN